MSGLHQWLLCCQQGPPLEAVPARRSALGARPFQSSDSANGSMVTARLTDSLPSYPDLELLDTSPQVLYPPESGGTENIPFPLSHRFAVPLPATLPSGSPLPGTLDLASAGAVRWALDVELTLVSGQVITSTTVIEGIPPDVPEAGVVDERRADEVALERGGVRTRLVVDDIAPRLGDALRLGVEVRPMERARTSLAGLASQPDPAESLRGLRRVRVDLVRRVEITPPQGRPYVRTTSLHSTGKGLRYPGKDKPLRVLFHLPTSHASALHGVRDEVTSQTTYHHISFVIRAQLGFAQGSQATAPGPSGSTSAGAESSKAAQEDWTVELPLTIRPAAWREPATVVIERGLQPELGAADPSGSSDAREAYRRKGLDVVGETGTTRLGEADLPPPFEGDAGPSTLPSFHESEAAARAGCAPLAPGVASARLVPVDFEPSVSPPDSGNELDTWVEYDGYETFSEAPPPAAASFGVESAMDPPRDGDEVPTTVAEDMAARLGLAGDVRSPAQLMQQLGLEQRVIDMHDDLPPGIDEPSLPALPGFEYRRGSHVSAHQQHQQQYDALPPQDYAPQDYAPPPQDFVPNDFAARDYDRAPPPPHDSAFNAPAEFGYDYYDPQGYEARTRQGGRRQPLPDMRLSPALAPLSLDEHPPSFDASEAAEAAGGVARSTGGPSDLPPGYFGAPSGGPPAYS